MQDILFHNVSTYISARRCRALATTCWQAHKVIWPFIFARGRVPVRPWSLVRPCYILYRHERYELPRARNGIYHAYELYDRGSLTAMISNGQSGMVDFILPLNNHTLARFVDWIGNVEINTVRYIFIIIQNYDTGRHKITIEINQHCAPKILIKQRVREKKMIRLLDLILYY